LNFGDRDGAVLCYREALARAEPLAGADRANVRAQRVLMYTYWRLGRMEVDANPRAAIEFYRKGLAIAEGMLGKDDSNIDYRRDVVLTSLGVARCSRLLGNTGEAMQLLNRAVAMQQRIEQVAPERIWMNRPLGWVHLEMGDVLLARNDPDGASQQFAA